MRGGLTAAAVAGVTACCIVLWRHVTDLQRRLTEEVGAREHLEVVRKAERTGRIAAEKRVAALLQQIPEVIHKSDAIFVHVIAIGRRGASYICSGGIPIPIQGIVVDLRSSSLTGINLISIQVVVIGIRGNSRK